MTKFIYIIILAIMLQGCYLPNSKDNAIDKRAKITTLAMIGSGLATEGLFFNSPNSTINKLGLSGARAAFGMGVAASAGSYFALEELYRYLDDTDSAAVTTLKLEALNDPNVKKTNQPYEYVNPTNGVKSRIRTLRTYVNKDNQLCRDYDETLIIQAQEVTVERTACQTTAGFWSGI
jgi:surface antigen